MARSKKYFGMTVSQVGILAGLAGLVFCLFGIGAWLISGNGVNFRREPEVTPIPISSPTLILPPTVTTTPGPTSIPYEQLIPEGWLQHKTELVEIWLPPAFKDTKRAIPRGVKSLAAPELILTKSASKTSLYNMWVIVSFEPLTAESLDAFLDVKFQSVSSDLRVVERRKVVVNSTEGVRVVIETRVNNVDVNELAYIFQDGGTVWYVMFGAQINEFYTELSSFEDSVLTFRWVK